MHIITTSPFELKIAVPILMILHSTSHLITFTVIEDYTELTEFKLRLARSSGYSLNIIIFLIFCRLLSAIEIILTIRNIKKALAEINEKQNLKKNHLSQFLVHVKYYHYIFKVD